MQIKYSIKDLERLSGIKAHTIRIWEQRYNLLTPERGGRQIRFYSNCELKKLLNVNFLTQCGFKISQIAQLSDAEIKEQLFVNASTNLKAHADYINLLILAMIEVDEAKFNTAINQSLQQVTFEECVENILFPFLRKIGIMWQVGDVNPAQEHFICNLIRQKLITKIDQLPYSDNEKKERYILYLPESEWHELSLLYYCYHIKKQGHNYLYLGQSVPYNDILNIIAQVKPIVLITIFTTPFINLSIEEYLKKLSHAFSEGKILVSGFQILKDEFKLPFNVISFSNTAQFLKNIT